MRRWSTRWRRARRYGVGQSWRAGIAYRLHDAAVLHGQPLSWDIGRLVGFGQHPALLPTAVPGETPGWDIEVLEEPHAFEPPIPLAWADDGSRAVGMGNPQIPRAVTAGVRRLRIRNATVQAGQSLVVGDHAALVPELLDRVLVASGHWEPGVRTCVSPWRRRSDHHPIDGATETRMGQWTATLWRAQDASRRLAQAISLLETVDDHFGHGMLDLLHRLRALRDLPSSWPVVVSERMPPNVVAWIHLLDPGRTVVRLERGVILRVDELVVPLEGARLWQDPTRCRGLPVVPATIDPCAMTWLQEHGVSEQRPRRRRVWIRRDRSPHSTIEGEIDLVGQARTAGFEDVFLQDLSLPQVRALMAETSHVIAPMASAVANLTMAPPGVRLVQLTDQVTWIDRYGSLAWLPAIGHQSAVLVGRKTPTGYGVSAGAMGDAMDWLLSDDEGPGEILDESRRDGSSER